jgi:hypothetical protein
LTSAEVASLHEEGALMEDPLSSTGITRREVMTLTVDKGWVTEASVEDVKLLPGVHRTIFRLEGGDWVAREIVKDVQAGRAKFVVNSGDVVWWGNQGLTIADSPPTGIASTIPC